MWKHLKWNWTQLNREEKCVQNIYNIIYFFCEQILCLFKVVFLIDAYKFKFMFVFMHFFQSFMLIMFT